MAVDEERLEAFVGQWIGDMGATASMMLAAMGDRLGLYRALQEGGPQHPDELGARTGVPASYLAAWLAQQAAGGYLSYDPEAGSYALPEEHAMVLAEPSSPVYLIGAAELLTSLFQDQDAIVEAYRSASGFGWHEHSENLFSGVRRFFSPRYEALLTSDWIPALDGLADRLDRGATVADVGCGHGVSSVALARAFERTSVRGFDNHEASVRAARRRAADGGVGDRVSFEVATAQDFPGEGYDLVCLFDCLHDMGDPVGALRHVRSRLADDGVVMVVEPQAGERVEENFTPVGRVYYGGAATICIPCAVDQGGAPRLHTQSSEADHRSVAHEAGFSRFRKATENPVNRVFELRA